MNNNLTLINKSDTPAVFEHPDPTTFSLGVYSSAGNTIHELSYWGMPDEGTDYPTLPINLWWNKEKDYSQPLYSLTAYFTAINGADIFLASNCIYIQRDEVETACGKDPFLFGYIEGNIAHPFKIKIIPSAEYIAEKPDSTTIKLSFQSCGNPVLYGAREKFPVFVGGDRSLLERGSIFYSILITIMLGSVYTTEPTIGINWSIS